MKKTQRLYSKAKKLIPGGTQLLSKRPELHLPDLWPSYYKKAKGCTVWDLDGCKYIDTSFMGIGASILGYCDKDVDKAVKEAIKNGTMSTLNCPEEVELADLLCKTHLWAKMARFARSGGEAAAIAVRIARTSTKREIVLFCGYHGWHDWYLSANLGNNSSLDGHLLPGLKPNGVPRSLKGTSIPFAYNDVEGFLKLINKYGKKVAAVIMEPVRNHYPKDNFLKIARKKTKSVGAVLIFDEITSGWRLNVGGSHLGLGVNPDVAIFAKGMSNGYPMAAIIGTRKVMSACQDTFISSTYWTERIGPVAALACIRKIKSKNVPDHLKKIGRMVQEGWKKAAKRNNLDIVVSGIEPLSHFSFNYNNHLVLKTLFTQKMLEKGFLATNSFYVSYAHKNIHINGYLKAVESVFGFISNAIKDRKVRKFLKGPVCQSGFKRLT